jgi:hypothetical protein
VNTELNKHAKSSTLSEKVKASKKAQGKPSCPHVGRHQDRPEGQVHPETAALAPDQDEGVRHQIKITGDI